MNKRQVVVLWTIALLLAAAAWIVRSGKNQSFDSKTQRSRGQTLIADLPATEVAKLEVRSGEQTTTLVRKDGKWTVAERENYPAKTSTVNEAIRTLAEVTVTDGIEAAPALAPRFGMDPGAKEEKDRGTEVVLSNDAGTELVRLTLGKNLEAAGDPMSMMGGGASGRFVRNHADETGVYKVGEIFPTLSAEPQGWLDDSFLKVEKIKAITVSPAAKPDEIAWKLTRSDENAEFTLDGIQPGETLDSTATSPLKSLFSYARFEDVIPAAKLESVSKAAEKQTVKIETFEGFAYTLTIAPMTPEPPKGDAPAEDSFILSVDLAAELPAERKKDEKESEEDAKTKDKAFADRKAELEKRLAAEKSLAGRYFKVTRYSVEALLKDRATLVKKAESAASPTPAGANNQTGRPIEAVTPPISIPPMQEGE